MNLILRYFKEAVRRFPRQFLASMALILVITTMDTFVPWGLRQYIDQVSRRDDYAVLALGIGFFACYLLVKVFIKIAWYLSLDRFGGAYIEELSLSAERSMAEASYADVERLDPAVVRNILYTDIFNVFRVIGHAAPSMLGALAVILAALGISFFCEPRMTVLILLAAAFGLLLSWLSRKVLSRTAGRTNAKMKVHDAWCTQFVEMLPLIQTGGLLDYYQGKTSANLRDFIDTAIREDWHTIFWTELLSGYHTLFSIALSALLAIPAAGNSVANLMFFTMVSSLIMDQSRLLESHFQQVMKMHVSFAHVEVLRTLPKRQTGDGTGPFSSVTFRDAALTYPGGAAALKHINCTMERGDCIRLSGPNGSGKSSFIKLLTGLYPPDAGEVLLDGIPLPCYRQEALERQILSISQDERLLNETFQDYLSLISGHPLEDEQARALLRQAGLPEDGRTIRDNGGSLSVGQRKKLLLLKLRLRLEEAPVVILDELTAGLDAETAGQVFALIRETAAAGDKLLLVIDHTCGDELPFTREFHFENGELHISEPQERNVTP